jgi:hypothetical protein
VSSSWFDEGGVLAAASEVVNVVASSSARTGEAVGCLQNLCPFLHNGQAGLRMRAVSEVALDLLYHRR